MEELHSFTEQDVIKVTRFIVHQQNVEPEASWEVTDIPENVWNCLKIDKIFSNALETLVSDAGMASGRLYPPSSGETMMENLSCFEARLAVNELISSRTTPFAQEMLKQVLLELKMPFFCFFKDKNNVTNLLRKAKNLDDNLPLTIFNHRFMFDKNNVVPSPPNLGDVGVFSATLYLKTRPRCKLLPPSVPSNAPLSRTRVDLWHVFRLFSEQTSTFLANGWRRKLLWIASLLNPRMLREEKPFSYFADLIASDRSLINWHPDPQGPTHPLLSPAQNHLQKQMTIREHCGYENRFLVPLDRRGGDWCYSLLENRIVEVRQEDDLGSCGYICNRAYMHVLPAIVVKANQDLQNEHTLIVCRPIDLFVFQKDCILHASNPLLYHGPKRCLTATLLSQHNIVLTTYNIVLSDFKKNRQDLLSREWHRIVLMDSEYLGTRQKIAESVIQGLKGVFRWCVSKRPFLKCCKDLKNQLLFLRPPSARDAATLDWIERNCDQMVYQWLRTLVTRRDRRLISPSCIALWYSLCLFPVNEAYKVPALTRCRVVRVGWKQAEVQKLKLTVAHTQKMLAAYRSPNEDATENLLWLDDDQEIAVVVPSQAARQRNSVATEVSWLLSRRCELLQNKELLEAMRKLRYHTHHDSPFRLKTDMTPPADHRTTAATDDCPVCLDSNSTVRVYSKCGHWLCHDCACHMCRNEPEFKCPLCRTVASVSADMWRETTEESTEPVAVLQALDSLSCRLQVVLGVLQRWCSGAQATSDPSTTDMETELPSAADSDLDILVLVVTQEARNMICSQPFVQARLKPSRYVSTVQKQTISVARMDETAESWYMSRPYTHVLLAESPDHARAYNILQTFSSRAQETVILRSPLDDFLQKYAQKSYIGYSTKDGKHPAVRVNLLASFSQKESNPIKQPVFIQRQILSQVLNELQNTLSSQVCEDPPTEPKD